VTALRFRRIAASGEDEISFAPSALVIAGWAGRDEAAIRHHIEELAAIGVPPPSAVPLFYRASAALLTQAPVLEVLGEASSGEAEPVIVSLADGLWIGLGSDHTDRAAEAQGVALSKQLCGKPIAGTLWRLEEIAPHWDRLVLRSRIGASGTLYQEAPLAALRRPEDLLARAGGLAPGGVMFGGTVAAIGGIRSSAHFAMELEDPVLGRHISHAYALQTLPVVS
jgi:hypothetical protein